MSYAPHTELERAAAKCPEWLHTLVGTQLGELARRELPGTPTGTVTDYASQDWDALEVEVLRWLYQLSQDFPGVELVDATRLRLGFVRMAENLTHWPQPAMLRPYVPPRSTTRSPDPARKQRGIAECRRRMGVN